MWIRPPSILILYSTGISGYIGGHVISRLLEKHPDYAVRALVRDDSQAGAVKSQLPSVVPVIGHLDSHQIIVDESEKADIVLSMMAFLQPAQHLDDYLNPGFRRSRVFRSRALR